MTGKLIYSFGNGKAEGHAGMKDLLGGKGANLAEMTNLGIPVPPGFTITTEVCTQIYRPGEVFPEALEREIAQAVKKVEAVMGKKFGDAKNPLLVSVRSGARASMPGMMDTILNLGLNEETTAGLAAATNNPRFAYDSLRRFIQMYANVVLGLDARLLEVQLEELKEARRVKLDTELSADDFKGLAQRLRKTVRERTGTDFPQDPWDQLRGAVGAVFRSWGNKRAIDYRRINGIPDEWGTACNVQAMVFGNLGDDSATGVAFTRDPSTGEKKFFGEYLISAQGEDVVAGIRTPLPIDGSEMSLSKKMPTCYRELVSIYQKLERHYKEMQDIEFTIEKGRLWMLQTRTGKRTSQASIRIAVEMVGEGLIDKKTAVKRIDPAQLDQLLHPRLDPAAAKTVLTKALAASPGAAVGRVVFSADQAESLGGQGDKVILVRLETSPEDIHGMHAAQGILTGRGGMTSHAAVVARGMGRPCVVGCETLVIDEAREQFRIGDHIVSRGDWITLDGTTGEVILGKVPTIEPVLSGEFTTLMGWVDQFRRLKVRANADTPQDAKVARQYGAEGIGLCRTEHMFFEPDRIEAVRQMIVADSLEARQAALTRLLPMQRSDFVGIFREMHGLPVTIRLLDPPLHEFLPKTDDEIAALARSLGIASARVREKVQQLHEFNPMLGHRGCRLGITYPEIYEMQVRAIAEAACDVKQEGLEVLPDIMIPLVGHVAELKLLREVSERVSRGVMEARSQQFRILIGTMIELPRAALTADQIAREAEFFSFGTNDLTQTTFGISRDDAGHFLPYYMQKKIFSKDPFVSLDVDGVGALIRIAVEKGRATRPNLKVGICGEHGGDPASVEFCHAIGLDYVSCSPYRVPIARLAAAQAVIKNS